MVRDSICANFFARAIKRFLAFAHTEDFCVQRLARTLSAHTFKQRASIGNQRDTAHCPILCGRFGVPPHNDFTSIKV